MIKLPETREQMVVNLLKLANTKIPADIGWALEAAAMWETGPIASNQLGAILDNIKKAEHLGRPMCQDTGIPTFFIRGRIDAGVEEDIRNGLRTASQTIPLRPNTVDPFTRENMGDNLGRGMPSIHYIPTDDDFTEISVLVKGAGSENMTRLGMLNPADGIKGVKRFVIDSVLDAGGRPCPPTIVGVGIGGTADSCLMMSKKALMAPLDSPSESDIARDIEEDLFVKLNRSGLGPMGLGGDTTVLAVKVRVASCHTASLPVAVSIGCWATRRASVRISNGNVEYSQGASL